jgi:Fe-S-cluster containining protein
MESKNCCFGCIGKNGNDCCLDVFIILNPDEIHLFNKHNGFNEVVNGGIFYTTQGCPYFHEESCQIHKIKPLYCKFYPIFITGKPFIHEECSIHKDYQLTDRLEQEIRELQQLYPIYQREWFWEEVKEELNIEY